MISSSVDLMPNAGGNAAAFVLIPHGRRLIQRLLRVRYSRHLAWLDRFPFFFFFFLIAVASLIKARLQLHTLTKLQEVSMHTDRISVRSVIRQFGLF